MKRVVVKSATNSASIPARPQVVNAAEDEVSEAIADKIKSAENDFSYIIDGLDQLSTAQCDEMLNRLHDDLQRYITDIADMISE